MLNHGVSSGRYQHTQTQWKENKKLVLKIRALGNDLYNNTSATAHIYINVNILVRAKIFKVMTDI